MFGFTNFTVLAVAKAGNLTLEFALGLVEEVVINVTAAGAADAAEIVEDIPLNIVSKDQIITSTSLAVSSKLLQSNVVGLIAGATPNLFL